MRLGAAHLMVERGGTWMTGPLEHPFGRGLNLQIAVPDVAAVAVRLEAEGWPLFRPMEDAWYRRGDERVGAREIVVQDPDGYLLWFSQHLGVRRALGPLQVVSRRSLDATRWPFQQFGTFCFPI